MIPNQMEVNEIYSKGDILRVHGFLIKSEKISSMTNILSDPKEIMSLLQSIQLSVTKKTNYLGPTNMNIE